jgi:uncharacterized protein (DUF433 family)
MEAVLEQLTPSEAAIAAGVSVPQIHRIIDEEILPEEFFMSASGVRRFRSDACILIAFYFDTAEILTKNARLQTIRNAMAHCARWSDWKDCVVEENAISVHFSEWFVRVSDHLESLKRAKEMVVEDPEILSGTPVIKGTRVPVHQIGALYDSGVPKGKILRSYPSLKDWQIELSSIYSRAVPQRGRPRNSLTVALRPKSIIKKRRRRSSMGK